MHKEDGTSYRGDAIVKWGNDRKTQHSIGRARDGKCELIVLTKAEGPEYYEDHLPFVSKGIPLMMFDILVRLFILIMNV